MKTLCAMAAALFMALAPALAGDLEDGMEAYDGGDYAQALAAWTRAAAAGQADAMVAIAGLYAGGTGVAKDLKVALIWYRRGARLGDVAGQLNLGDMIARGKGQERDPVEASMWLGLAAAQGNLWAAERKREVDRTLIPGPGGGGRQADRGLAASLRLLTSGPWRASPSGSLRTHRAAWAHRD